jgi:hypothetical protein
MILRGITLTLNKYEKFSYSSYLLSIPSSVYKWALGKNKEKDSNKYSQEIKAQLFIGDNPNPISILFNDISNSLNNKILKLDKNYKIYQTMLCTYIDPNVRFITINILDRHLFISLSDDKDEDHVTEVLFGYRSLYNPLYDNIINDNSSNIAGIIATPQIITYSIYHSSENNEALTMHTCALSGKN